MRFKDALNVLMESEEVRSRIKEGYYLSSLLLTPENFSEVNEWHFIFFHPKTGDVFSVAINKNGIQVGIESQPLVEGNYEKLELDNLNPMEILPIIERETQKLNKNKVTKIIITLRKAVWRAAVMTADMKMLRIDINHNTKKVIKSESTSILR
ncbi:MAG: hypothetical protein J7L23_04235 [Candidatus Diapherotrites archaeon]|nr:hypothetical protein [Candidatus Diapherotrites archaeon]